MFFILVMVLHLDLDLQRVMIYDHSSMYFDRAMHLPDHVVTLGVWETNIYVCNEPTIATKLHC